MARQVAMLESFCFANGWTYEVIEDLGSGVNCRKRGLRQLIRRICLGDVGRLVVTQQDRLLHFGADLVFALCEQFATEVVLVNAAAEESSGEEDLVEDVLEILNIFSARLYGSRRRKNKQLADSLRAAAEEVARG
uniref:IS607 family transposase n=1 Tax=Kamptonema formosum TaxID=331992 RepID=UPI001E531BF2|nr:IS607 family transposase [Oscillatoria sp. PCC 10802]